MKKFLFLSVVLYGTVAISFSASASVVWNDSFDSYDNGNLSGNDNWYKPAGAEMVVNTTQHLSPDKSIYTPSDLGQGYRNFASSTRGIFTFHFFASQQHYYTIYFSIGDINGDKISVWWKNYVNGIYLETDDDPLFVASYTLNVWHKIDFEYDFIQDWVRARYDDGSWSATSSVATSGLDFNTLAGFYFTGGSYDNQFYFDDISLDDFDQNQSTTTCGDIFTEPECWAEDGCSWWVFDFTGQYIYPTTVFGACVPTNTIPAVFSTTTPPYTTEALCEAAGYTWIPGSGCYAMTDEAIASSTAGLNEVNILSYMWEMVAHPQDFFSTLMTAFDFRNKPPVSWVIGIFSIVNQEMASSSDLTVDESAFGTSTIPMLGGNLSVKFVNFDWIRDRFPTQLAAFRLMLLYVFWLGFCSYAVVEARSFFHRITIALQ